MDINLKADTPPSTSRLHLTDWLIALAVGTFALAIYVLTLTPSLSYLSPDGSELATIPYVLGLAHSPGYPVYTWLGYIFSRLLPFGDVAHRVNLMSAVLGAMGVSGLYLICIQLLPDNHQEENLRWRSPKGHFWLKRPIAACAASLFAFSVDFWSQALIAEVYAPNIGFISLTLLLLIGWAVSLKPWHYFGFALVFGLSLGTHLSNLGFAPAYAFFTLLGLIPQKLNSHHQTQIDSSQTTLQRLLSYAKDLLTTAFSGGLGFILGVAQFAWLPFRANTLNDRFMLRNAPKTLDGLYNYTLGAFPNFKFAFPLAALPERLVIYLDLLRQQFGIFGIAIGIAGLFTLLFLRPRHFYLIIGMYLVNVWFFIQYNAFDLEVFFIPAHFLWTILIAFGLWGAIRLIFRLVNMLLPEGVLDHHTGVWFAAVVSIGTLALAAVPILKNWDQNDFSDDTAINDFYANIWEILPQDSALITPGGVFGYDAFYWKLVYGTRPDVVLPTLPSPNPTRASLVGHDLYATTRAIQGNKGPGSLPPDLLDKGLWEIPVLLGEQPEAQTGKRQSLVLYHLTPSPPVIVPSNTTFSIPLNANLGTVTLSGADVTPGTVESGSYIHIKLYWRIRPGQRLPRVAITLDGNALAQHEVGFGLIPRYHQEIGIDPADMILDEYDLVIPSTIPPGEWALKISTIDLRQAQEDTVRLTDLIVTDESGWFEAWLETAHNEE